MKQREPSRKLLALALAPLLGACAASSVVPDPEERDVVRAQKLDAQADLSRLKHGRDRFVHRCSSCHDLPSPRDLKPEEWP
ncbi:hypothetical protein HY251_05475, partial [bacterium]|nr:hypothetical protein [bacterium]